MLWQYELEASVSTAFSSSRELSIEKRKAKNIFFFYISYRKHRDEKKGKPLVNFHFSKFKLSLLASSLRQKLLFVLDLCRPHRVIQTRFLTNKHMYFLRTVF